MVEKRLGAMEDSQDILRVAGARARVGLYEAMEALFDERRLVEHRSWRDGFLDGIQGA